MSNITLMGVIISYPTLFTAKAFTNSQGVPQGDPKYSADFLISPNHPQRAIVEKMASDAETAGFPGGMPSGCNNAVRSYDELYNGSDSYNPSLSGWLVVKCTAKQDNKPAVVDINKQEVIDPSSAYGGAKVNAAIGISAIINLQLIKCLAVKLKHLVHRLNLQQAHRLLQMRHLHPHPYRSNA